MGEAPVELYQEFLGDISHEIDRETSIIEDLLTMVRLEKSDNQIQPEPVNINEMLERILKSLKLIAKQRNIEVTLESYRPVIAEVDDIKFSRAMTNLIENAIKYNKDNGEVKVSLNADHNYFYIKIVDTGVGIPEDAKDKIFERFYRVDKARSRDTGGTGLGLAITKSIIQLHHGVIRVYSELGEGSTFHIRIPLNFMR
jgi:signal transduction histidine kinase